MTKSKQPRIFSENQIMDILTSEFMAVGKIATLSRTNYYLCSEILDDFVSKGMVEKTMVQRGKKQCPKYRKLPLKAITGGTETPITETSEVVA